MPRGIEYSVTLELSVLSTRLASTSPFSCPFRLRACFLYKPSGLQGNCHVPSSISTRWLYRCYQNQNERRAHALTACAANIVNPTSIGSALHIAFLHKSSSLESNPPPPAQHGRRNRPSRDITGPSHVNGRLLYSSLLERHRNLLLHPHHLPALQRPLLLEHGYRHARNTLTRHILLSPLLRPRTELPHVLPHLPGLVCDGHRTICGAVFATTSRDYA